MDGFLIFLSLYRINPGKYWVNTAIFYGQRNRFWSEEPMVLARRAFCHVRQPMLYLTDALPTDLLLI